jgi:hypothetical protein
LSTSFIRFDDVTACRRRHFCQQTATVYGSWDKRMKTAYRFLVLLTAVRSTNVAIAGNFDVEIHCFPKRIDQSVRTASDGGVNQTRERWVYDLTIENKTSRELTDLDLKYVIFFTQERLGLKADPGKRE